MRPPRLLATMAHLPRRLPVLVFLFLVLHDHVVPASHGAPLLPPTYDPSICSESFTCGNVDIRYPFYLSNATELAGDYVSSYSCGYTDLKIFCQDEHEDATKSSPIIQLDQYNYTVKSISYDTSTILLVDADAFRGGNRCPVVRHNVTFGADWLRYAAGSHDNLTFFFGCNDPRDDPMPPGFDAYRINCTGFSNSPVGGDSFVFSSEDVHDVARKHELARHCSEVVVVPVLRDALLRSDQSTLPSEYGTVLGQGFELVWNRTTADQCYACEQSGGRCAYNQNRNFLACLCDDGQVGVRDCSASPPSSKSFRKWSFLRIYLAYLAICISRRS